VPVVEVDLRIGPDEYLKRYRVPGALVFAHSLDGRRVQFPANILQRFVTHIGVVGRFAISFDAGGKLMGIERVAGPS
jgi:hypothetical protein